MTCYLGNILEGIHIKHIRTHTGEKPHQCDMGFSNKHILINHIRTHTGMKLFKYSQCGKSFLIEIISHAIWRDTLERNHTNVAIVTKPFLTIVILQDMRGNILERNHLNAVSVVKVSYISFLLRNIMETHWK